MKLVKFLRVEQVLKPGRLEQEWMSVIIYSQKDQSFKVVQQFIKSQYDNKVKLTKVMSIKTMITQLKNSLQSDRKTYCLIDFVPSQKEEIISKFWDQKQYPKLGFIVLVNEIDKMEKKQFNMFKKYVKLICNQSKFIVQYLDKELSSIKSGSITSFSKMSNINSEYQQEYNEKFSQIRQSYYDSVCSYHIEQICDDSPGPGTYNIK